MDNAIVSAEKDDHKKENTLHCTAEDIASAEEDCLSKRLVREGKPEDVPLLNVKKSQISVFCVQKLFLQQIYDLNKRIPKQIMSLDEKYLRHCLNLIHISAVGVASWNVPSKMDVLSESFSSRLISTRSTCDTTSVIASGTENVFISSTGDLIFGTVTESTSMINILKSPLFRQLGALDYDVNFGRTSLFDVKEPISSAVMSSRDGLCFSSSQKLQKERAVLEDQIFGSEPAHKRVVSVSSTNSTTFDQPSTSTSAGYCQGMLHRSWNNGFPHYVFSVDDQREIYIANLMKVKSPNDKVLDYMYMFHSRGGKKGNEIHQEESDLVGQMRVSTSFTLCPNNTEIMETQFVLCGASDNCIGGMQTSSHTIRKNKGLSKKVVDIFRASQSYRQRTSSKFGGMNAIQENLLEPCRDSSNNFYPIPRTVFSENDLPPNFELAAIIVRNPIRDNHKEVEIGGWGLKFLKKVGNVQTKTSPVSSVPSESCRQNTGDCSTCMDVLVPAGFHGGPRTRNGGPSCLIERWRGGGRCDCGGWDIGCPLTVLNTRPNNKEVFPQADFFEESNTFDLFIQGSKQNAPIIKMVNIHDGLYYIHYQSTLSALQSLSIAVANIHSRSPTLRPKVYRTLK